MSEEVRTWAQGMGSAEEPDAAGGEVAQRSEPERSDGERSGASSPPAASPAAAGRSPTGEEAPTADPGGAAPAGVPALAGRTKGRRLVHKDAAQQPGVSPDQRVLLLDTWQRSGLSAGAFGDTGRARHPRTDTPH